MTILKHPIQRCEALLTTEIFVPPQDGGQKAQCARGEPSKPTQQPEDHQNHHHDQDNALERKISLSNCCPTINLAADRGAQKCACSGRLPRDAGRGEARDHR